jgi:hypothetical protein
LLVIVWRKLERRFFSGSQLKSTVLAHLKRMQGVACFIDRCLATFGANFRHVGRKK